MITQASSGSQLPDVLLLSNSHRWARLHVTETMKHSLSNVLMAHLSLTDWVSQFATPSRLENAKLLRASAPEVKPTNVASASRTTTAPPPAASRLRRLRKQRSDKQSQVKKTMNLPSRLLQLRRCHLGGGRKLQIPACSHHLLLLLLYRAMSTFLQLMCKPLRRKSSAQPLPLLIQT